MTTLEKMDRTLKMARTSAHVPRWSIVPTVQKQNVAEHTFQVIAICYWLCRYDPHVCFEKVLELAYIHDLAETVSSDIASPFKRMISTPVKTAERGINKNFVHGYRYNDKKLYMEELAYLKVADLIEALIFLYEEDRLGNRVITDVYRDIEMNLKKAWEDFPFHGKPISFGVLISDITKMIALPLPGMWVVEGESK